MSDTNAPKKRNEVEARQGSTKPGLIYVLGAGIVLVIIAFAIVWAMSKH